ncbi:MAG: hypothetical protein WC803_06270 [Sphingomonas sp.]
MRGHASSQVVLAAYRAKILQEYGATKNKMLYLLLLLANFG